MDAITNVLSDPGMNYTGVPYADAIAFISSSFSLFRSIFNVPDTSEEERNYMIFIKLINAADGYTPVCVKAKLYRLTDFTTEWEYIPPLHTKGYY